MHYKLLGRTGVRVSQLCLGTMPFGGDAAESDAADMFSASRDAGINFFDCADVYAGGESERVLGRLIKGVRDELVITTKCFGHTGADVNSGGGNRRHILRAVEASLQRLGTDRIDVLFMHRWEPDVPLEETLRALENLVSDGKVLYLGASNYAAWQIARGLGISESRGWPRFDVIQPMYSLVKRQAESEIFPMAISEELGVISYSPVGGGLLSGKYGKAKRPETARIVDNPEYASRYSQEWVFDVAENFTELAGSRGVHPVSLAVAWAAAHPAVTCPIVAGRNIEQLKPSLQSVDIAMDDGLYEEIRTLSPDPAPATDRLEEQLNPRSR